MAFEKFGSYDYSTEDKIDGTVQDKIDILKTSTQKSLQELRVDLLSQTKILTVDTLNTRLNVRDNNGNIIGKLADKTEVSYSGKAINKEGKLFLSITMPNGGEGYVSADYVRADIYYKHDVVTNDETVVTNDETVVTNDETVVTNDETVVTNEISLGESFIRFKEIVKKYDTNFELNSGEEIQEMKIIIAGALQELMLTINHEETKDKPNTTLINESKIYLAHYFADEGDVENQYGKNYDLSTNIALDILPESKNKPEPISEDKMNMAMAKNVGLMHFVKSIAMENNSDSASEKMEKIHKSSIFIEMMEGLNDEYQTNLENYLENIDDSKFTAEQKSALTLLNDIHGIGWFDIAEKNADMVQDLSANLGIIAGSMWISAKTGTVIGGTLGATGAGVGAIPGAIIGFIGGAIIGGATATIGMSLYNGDTDLLNGKEFAINSATMGAIGGIAKGAKMIQGNAKLFTKAGIGSLGAEAVGDIALAGVGIDGMRASLYEEYDFNFNESFVANLQWALLPIATRSLGAGKSAVFSEKRILAGKEAIAKMQLAKMLKNVGDKIGMKKTIESLEVDLNTHRIGLSKPTKSQTRLHQKINEKADGGIDTKGNKIDKNSSETLYVTKKGTVLSELIPANKNIQLKIDGKNYDISTSQNGRISIKDSGKKMTIREVQTFIEQNQVVLREKLGMKAKKIVSDNVTLNEYKHYIDTGKVSSETLEKIAKKVSSRTDQKNNLTPEETAIYNNKTIEISKIIKNKFKNNNKAIQKKYKEKEVNKENIKVKDEITGKKQDNGKSSPDNKTDTKKTSESEIKINSFEKSRFKDLFKQKFNIEKVNSVTYTNKTGEELLITKHQNGKFTIGENSKIYKQSEVLNKIDSSFKLETLEKHIFKNIMKLSKNQEFTADRTWGIPGTAKVSFGENGFIEIKTKSGTKILKTEAEKKVFLENPKIRESVLKQKLEQLTPEEILSNIKGMQGFKNKLGQFKDGTLILIAQRFKALIMSGLIGGTSSLGLSLLSGGSQLNSSEDKFWDLAMTFSIGAGLGIILSIGATGWVIIKEGGKLSGTIIKSVSKVAVKNITKKRLITTGVVGIGGYTAYEILSD